MSKRILLIIVLSILLAGCGNTAAPPTAAPPDPTALKTNTPQPSPTNTATTTPTATIIPTATQIPTATWAVAGPGEVVAPILMYHHIDPEDYLGSRYNTPPDEFAAQMQALDEWGYTTITASQLVSAIMEGAPLPPRPVVITFDDGHYSVYKYAFPIMQEHDFIGVSYMVANRLQAYGFTGKTQLKEMLAAGWEVGSHSYTHSDLTLDHSIAYDEIYYSRVELETVLDASVKTFAYPFGSFDQYVGDRTSRWGYTAGMGLGKSYTHSPYTLYYLSRIEVQGGVDRETFASLLPWSDPQN